MEKLKQWEAAAKKSFQGWDFSSLNQEVDYEALRWDYKEIVLKVLSNEMKVLDMGTGGGEFLLTLNHPYSLTSVTEGYEPNYQLCKETLEPLGITVKFVETDNILDYPTESFDLVINRHEEYDASEVYRVLKTGGLFITQQVGCHDNYDLVEKVMGSFNPNFPTINMKDLTQALVEQNFKIIKTEEQYPECHFKSIEALIYYASIIEWQFTDFSVKESYQNLLKLEDELSEFGYIKGHDHRLLLIAQK